MADLESIRKKIICNSKSISHNDLRSNKVDDQIYFPNETLNQYILSNGYDKSSKLINIDLDLSSLRELKIGFSSEESLADSNRINVCESGFIDDENFSENKFVGNYIFIKPLGSGSTARVFLAYDRFSGKKVALKVIKRNFDAASNQSIENDGFNDFRIYRETIVSSLIDHPHIAKLLDFMFSNTHFFLVFEYAKGMSLYETILKNPRIPEDKARKYFRHLVSAVDYLHKNCIVHRDLKIENIVIDQNDNLKLIDFGLSNFFDNSALLRTFCGSLYFAAPELLMGLEYSGQEVDIWSLGIILYVMLCGKVPFDDENVKELQLKIKNAKIEYPNYLSKEVKNLLSCMISSFPEKRITINQVITSIWLNQGYSKLTSDFLVERTPITEINEECVLALSKTLSFQFATIKEDLCAFKSLCDQKNGYKEPFYWLKNSIISLYYLLSENLENYYPSDPKYIKFHEIEDAAPNSYLENLHSFVRFVFGNDVRNIPIKFFSVGAYENSYIEHDQLKLKPVDPIIKKSYFKGIFQGIKVKHIGNHNALKKTLLDIFKKRNVSFEADERSYYCTFVQDECECYFKITLYYNVLLSEYYLVMKCLNSQKECFRKISEIIEGSLKIRN